jgi:hypothetical protein
MKHSYPHKLWNNFFMTNVFLGPNTSDSNLYSIKKMKTQSDLNRKMKMALEVKTLLIQISKVEMWKQVKERKIII